MNKMFLIIVLLVSNAATAQIMGYAYPQNSPSSSALLYTEFHQYAGSLHNVVYKTALQKEFARKTIDYTLGLNTPNIEFSNDHCSERYHMSHNSNISNKLNTSTSLKIDYYNGCDQKTLKTSVTMSAPYVVDAGFDNFIRQQQEKIRQQSVTFSYPLPSRAQSVLLTAESVQCSDFQNRFGDHLQKIELHKDAQLHWHDCVKVVPHSWFLAKLISPIYLAYSSGNELQLFAGNSNIGDARGDYKNVVIFYRSADETLAKNSI